MQLLKSLLVILPLLPLACSSGKTAADKSIRYVALGDSYTICQGATENESWPVILSRHLTEKGIPVTLVANPSRTGYTTRNLIQKELPVFDASDAGFVTLCIGVNDWVQGSDSAAFHKNLITILDHVQQQLKIKTRVLLLTIPDFSVTPGGKQFGSPDEIKKGLQAFNRIIVKEALKRKLPCVDLYPVSLDMENKPELVAADGLHPSAMEYAIWETLILPEAEKMLR